MTPEMEAELHKSLGCINATLIRIEQNLTEHKKLTKRELEHLTGRVRQTESKINWAGGAAAVIGSVGAIIFGGWYR